MKQLLHGIRRAALSLPLTALAAPCAAFLLSAAALGGQFSPWALAAVAAAGTGWNGAAAGLGALLGALAFLDFQPGLRHGAAALLIRHTFPAATTGKMVLLVRFLVCTACACSVYVAVLLATRCPELMEALAAVRARLDKRRERP